MSEIPAFVIGASGYVGGELLRLIGSHPRFELAGAISRDPGEKTIASEFAHLAPLYGETPFVNVETALATLAEARAAAVFSAAPHGQSATLLAEFDAIARNGTHIVDVSADFRFTDLKRFEAIYGCEHGAPELATQFTAAPPELTAESATRHVAHPGCFATAMLLAAAPLVAAELVGPDLYITGITGSTGSGKTPTPTTHHPERHANLYSYKPLVHRHAAEVDSVLTTTTGQKTQVRFVPHSGPFARGIIVNLQAPLTSSVSTGDLRESFKAYYAEAPFVRVRRDGTARLGHVVGSNYVEISVASDGNSVAVSAAIDNLVKGAAGGAVQWMNRLFGLADTTGLTAPACGWT
ncbi:MAG: N-acetyl-gamma-glutamyl-phosphate reductase [Pseudomonadota bacterium]